MAELLVKAVSVTHSDPVKDRRGCYKRGDVVAVEPDGHTWGKDEGLPKFVVVRLPGVDPSLVREYLVPETVQLVFLAQPEEQAVTKRKWNFRLDDLPAAIRSRLLDSGRATLSLTETRAYMRDRTAAR